MPLSRRSFLSTSLTSVGGLFAVEQLLRDPYRPMILRSSELATPIRIRGRVTLAGKPVARVGVSDGWQVVATDAEGRYTLLTTSDRSWLSISLPSGAQIPVSRAGTSELHQRIRVSTKGDMIADFALKPSTSNDDQHSFVVLADPQCQNAFEMERMHKETVPDVRRTFEQISSGQKFGVTCGDITFDHPELYPDYERAALAMSTPFFQVVGNHDLDYSSRTTEDATHGFEQRFGPANYSFNVGRMHYAVLNDVLWFGTAYAGYLTTQQLQWLEADLALIDKGRPVVVCLHIPLASTMPVRSPNAGPGIANQVNNREALYRLLEGHNAHVIAGHTHENEHIIANGVHEHVLGTACGAWWSGDICWDGTPNGYGVFEVNDEVLNHRYQSTGQPATHQMRLYRRGADPKAADEFIANVWDWSPEWTVTWSEDGERRGVMSRRIGLDPRTVVEQTGPDKPARRGWVEPTPTGHLFYATPSREAKSVAVEAKDGFGRVYREEIRLV